VKPCNSMKSTTLKDRLRNRIKIGFAKINTAAKPRKNDYWEWRLRYKSISQIAKSVIMAKINH